jgi:hypothetical protein
LLLSGALVGVFVHALYADLTLTQGDGITITKSGVGGNITVAAKISDEAYGAAWDGNTTYAPTKNSVYDKINSLSAGYTNLTSFVDQTAWRIFYSDGSGDVKELALGAANEYLKSQGASSIPTWGAIAGGSESTSVTDTATVDLTLTGTDITADLKFASILEGLWFAFRSFTSAILANTNIYKPVPYNCTITGYDVTSSSAGNFTADILKCTHATFGTWTSMAGTELPTLTGNTTAQDLNLSSWNGTINANDYIMANVTAGNITGTVRVYLRGQRR